MGDKFPLKQIYELERAVEYRELSQREKDMLEVLEKTKDPEKIHLLNQTLKNVRSKMRFLQAKRKKPN